MTFLGWWVKTWPFKWLVKWPPTRGWKGHVLNHLGPGTSSIFIKNLYCFLPLRQIFHLAEKRDAISFLALRMLPREKGWSELRFLDGDPPRFRWFIWSLKLSNISSTEPTWQLAEYLAFRFDISNVQLSNKFQKKMAFGKRSIFLFWIYQIWAPEEAQQFFVSPEAMVPSSVHVEHSGLWLFSCCARRFKKEFDQATRKLVSNDPIRNE